jgi:tRNA(His) 5'-end guanylyltransferase
MNAVLAIVADDGRAIVVIYTEGEEINFFLLYFIDSDITL